jgi:hypothetical protein
MNSLALADIANQDLSYATSITTTNQQIAQSFGVACAAFMLHLVAGDTRDNVHWLTPAVFQHVFIGLGLITLLSGAIFFCLRPTDGLSMLRKAE